MLLRRPKKGTEKGVFALQRQEKIGFPLPKGTQREKKKRKEREKRLEGGVTLRSVFTRRSQKGADQVTHFPKRKGGEKKGGKRSRGKMFELFPTRGERKRKTRPVQWELEKRGTSEKKQKRLEVIFFCTSKGKKRVLHLSGGKKKSEERGGTYPSLGTRGGEGGRGRRWNAMPQRIKGSQGP